MGNFYLGPSGHTLKGLFIFMSIEIKAEIGRGKKVKNVLGYIISA